MAFDPIYSPFASKPKAQALRNPVGGNPSLLRDNFTIVTWLLVGAFLQGILSFLPYRNLLLVLPVALVLVLQISRTLLQAFGVLSNPYMDGVIDGRTAAVFPDEKGTYDKPGDKQICAILLAVRSNSALGMFAPGFKEVGDYFTAMNEELERESTKHGFLGNSSWLSASDRGVSSEFMSVMYFDSSESLHAYAHGPLHTKAMEWWHKTAQQHKHIGIMHEVFACPKNNWEGIYLNYHATGLGGTVKETKTADGKTAWMNPLVRAKGKLLYSKGRMGRPFAEGEWSAFNEKLEQGDVY